MGQTAIYRLPWPEFPRKPLVAPDIKALAEAVESALDDRLDDFLKAGGGTYGVENNGYIRIPAADCFFNGRPPSTIEFTPVWPGDIISFALFDGGGALATVRDIPNNRATNIPGTGVTTMWAAFR